MRRALRSDRVRAREPDAEGRAVRDGVGLWWDSWGSGEDAVYLLPPWGLVHSATWQQQIPALARHLRVLTSDPLGNGRSDPCRDPDRYTAAATASDCLAVMDAAGVRRAIVVGHSRAAQAQIVLAADHGDRVLGAVFVAPFLPVTPSLFPFAATHPWLRPLFLAPTVKRPRGWGRMNASYWRRDFEAFAHWFARRALSVPHAETMVADTVEFARDGDLESLVASTSAPTLRGRRAVGALADRIGCPVLVICGDEDRVTPPADGAWLARRTKGRLISIAGADHCPHARHGVIVTEAILDHSAAVLGRPRSAPPRSAGPAGGRRVLFLSSPIGLGHARRDLAIARELRRIEPDVEVVWLTQHPTTALLEREGETIHPASALLASECAVIEAEADGHRLDVFRALRRSDGILAANYHVFFDVVRSEAFDLWIGDEAWEVDHFLHEHPDHKRAPFVWLTDFVGMLPTAGDDERTRELIADRNALMVEQLERHPGVRDRSIFIGDLEDCVGDPLGPGLPTVAELTRRRFDAAGYVAGAAPPSEQARAEIRASLGWRPDEQVCVAAVGGSGVGGWLLDRIIASHGACRARVPGLRTLAVAGPRLVPPPTAEPGLTVTGYLHGLDRVLAAADVAIVQGGLATTMEAAIAEVPFIYVPLERHFEQQVHVAARLARHGVGRRVDPGDLAPGSLARAVERALDAGPPTPPRVDGAAARVASMIAEVLPGRGGGS